MSGLEYKQRIKQQLIGAYARVQYTYTAHHKYKDRISFFHKVLKSFQIFLTAVSSTGFLVNIVMNQVISYWISGITVLISLALNLYTANFNLEKDEILHKKAADELWDVREEYVALITDIDLLTIDEIRNKRDFLKKAVSKINKKYPGTDKHSYRVAKKAIKYEEEQTFNEGEAEKLLHTGI